MPYVLADGRGQKIGLYTTCLDISYAQAELLLMVEKAKLDHPDAFIVGYADSQLQISVERFLEPHKQYPKELERIEELRSKIKAKGMHSFTVRHFDDDWETFLKSKPLLQIGRCIDSVVNQMVDFKAKGKDEEVAEMVEDIFANPLHAGIHQDFPPTVSDEIWIADAAKSIRRITPEKWLRRLLHVMRFYFKGKPKIALPHKNDRCPCGSSKKYGKCCGYGVEHEDPENCKLGMHQFTMWEEVDGKFIRTCEKCFRVYEAPWFEEVDYDGVDILVIGCRACAEKPTDEDFAREMEEAQKWHICGSCMKPFGLRHIILEHTWSDGKHIGHWKGTEIDTKEEAVDLQSIGLGKGVFLHKECFMKAIPGWPKSAKPSGRGPAKEIMRDITPTAS